jgi:CubicO group peptidase (beta-lactamase class C family)
MKNHLLTFILLLAFQLNNYAQQSNSKLAAFDKYVAQAQKNWKVPGMAITIVKDGKVLFSKGYGHRTLGKAEKVNLQTLFGAMSTTKAMTSLGLALLVDEGKIAWTDKVIQHLPDFKIADSYITKELTIKDLLTHNGGLGNADFLWSWSPQQSSDHIVERMQYAEPAYSFRGGYTYQNIMYLVAGKVIEKISGQSWEAFTEERIFKTLGMHNSFASLARSKHYTNRSLPHYEINNKIEIIEETSADPVAPAGAVWSTAEDIAHWVNFLLNNKMVSGKPFIKDQTLAEFFKPQVNIPKSQFYPTTALTKPNWTTYGLGWFQHDYRGEMLNFHTGSLAGRTAIIGLLRDKNIGVYIFGNLDHAEVRHALMYKVFDLFAFDDDSRDWSGEMLKLYGGLKKKGDKYRKKMLAKRVLNTQPSHDLAAYVGTYSDPFYGKIKIIKENHQLVMQVSDQFQATLSHWHFDTFQAKWNKAWWGKSLMSFDLDAVTGDVKALKLGDAKLMKE